MKFTDKSVKIIDEHTISFKSGKDVQYYDAPAEQLKKITTALENRNWRDVIYENYAEKNPWLYKIITNSNRSDFIFLINLEENNLALDLGAGWGQISIPLSRICDVVAVEGSIEKVEIMKRIAHQENVDNILFVLSNIFDLSFEKNQFNLVIFNGVLEWVGEFSGEEDGIKAQEMALRKAYELLSQGGYLYIGIENKYGLKYLLGEIDDHTGLKDFTYISKDKAKEIYKNKFGKDLKIFVHSKTEYEKMLKDAGFSEIRFFGALPDYKIPNYLIDLSDSAASKYFIKYMDFVMEHKGSEDGAYSEYNEKLEDLYPLFASIELIEYLYPSYSIIAKKEE